MKLNAIFLRMFIKKIKGTRFQKGKKTPVKTILHLRLCVRVIARQSAALARKKNYLLRIFASSSLRESHATPTHINSNG